MKRLLPAGAILAFLILPQVAQAQYVNKEQLAKVDKDEGRAVFAGGITGCRQVCRLRDH